MATKFFDRSSLRKAVVTDAGFLKAPATLTRVGVFHYAPPGEKPFTVLRLPEEVFSPESMSSFELVPVVNTHPIENDGVVNSNNAKRLQVGSAGTPFRNGDLLDGTLMITDADTIKDIREGKAQISCGYFADKEPATPGAKYCDPITGELTPYDFVQRNIRGNHIAIVQYARAGEMARLHLDAACEVDTAARVVPTFSEVKETQSSSAAPGTAGQKNMNEKITIDGLTFEVSANGAAALAKERKASSDLITASETAAKTLKASADKLQATCDARDAEVKQLTAEIAKLKDPATIAKIVADRVAVEKLASEHGITADGKDMPAIKREVCKKLNADLNLDGKSADYVDAMFDLLSAKPKTNAVTDAADKLIGQAPSIPMPVGADARRKAFNDAVFKQDATNVKA